MFSYLLAPPILSRLKKFPEVQYCFANAELILGLGLGLTVTELGTISTNLSTPSSAVLL